MLKMLLFIICEAPKIISAIFGPFLTIFTLFHLQFFLWSKNLQQIISGTPQFMIGLVNNARNKCQKLVNFFQLLTFLQRRCILCSPFIFLSSFSFLTKIRLCWVCWQKMKIKSQSHPVKSRFANRQCLKSAFAEKFTLLC